MIVPVQSPASVGPSGWSRAWAGTASRRQRLVQPTANPVAGLPYSAHRPSPLWVPGAHPAPPDNAQAPSSWRVLGVSLQGGCGPGGQGGSAGRAPTLRLTLGSLTSEDSRWPQQRLREHQAPRGPSGTRLPGYLGA